ncbi:MAG: SUMF1/EgtB/PvdO family nonheme iron enzyme [Bryobacterales bacterium]|nr:SUMF1/EgtB/PvdO family nonheme iron enzyme [Bryobacterales bacterium]
MSLFVAIQLADAQDLRRVEAAKRTVTDSITGLPMTVSTSAYLLGRAEVTQVEFERTMGKNPSRFHGAGRPVENVTWLEALEYCNRRSVAEGLSRCYGEGGTWDRACTGYRLPTDAEWTAAAEETAKTLPADANLYDGETSVKAIATRAAEGTRSVENPDSSSAVAGGFADLFGNVWELCFDRFSNQPIIDSVWNPAGPQTGDARVIRSGSFLTQRSQWNKGFRASQPPSARSAYTGFRVARSLPSAARADTYEISGVDPVHSTEPPARPDVEIIRNNWMRVLGRPPLPKRQMDATLTQTFLEPAWTARLIELKLEDEAPWRSLLVLPAHAAGKPLPVILVPYYDVDTPAGKNMGGRSATPSGVRAFAHLAAQFGMAAMAVTWSGENDGPGYLEVVAGLDERYPGVTGLGYWVWQSQQIVNWLTAQPEVDAQRIGIIGHSLGGKMALYASAFDPRIRAIVSSEPGIALEFSNYGDPWYFGERLGMLPAGADQHELLELIAPRPFLLIGGESADGDKSLAILRKAAPAYAALGKPDALCMLNHRSGHSPTPAAAVTAMAWLHKQLTAR